MNMPDLDGVNSTPDGPKKKLGEDLEKRLRDLWIIETRRYHLKTTGRPSNYLPGPRLDGGRDIHGGKFKPIWPGLAEFVKANNLSPDAFIKAQFANCRGKPPLSPAMIKNSKAIRRCKTYQDTKEFEQTLRIAKDGQIRQAYNAVEANKSFYGPGANAYRAVIMDLNLPLSALFRYALSYTSQQTDLAEIWYEPALAQYVFDSGPYDEVWGDLIPPPLREAAQNTK
jgi:hypothetical protein